MVLYNNSHKTLEQHCCYKEKSKENHTSEAAWIKMGWDALCNDTGQSEDNDIQWQDSLLIVRSGVAASALLSCLLVLILATAFAFKDEDARHLPTVRIVLCITLASIIRLIIIVIQVLPVLDDSFYDDTTYCIITGYLYRNISMIVVLFTLTATLHTLLVTFAVKHSWKLEVGYILLPIILPFAYTWIPFLYHPCNLEDTSTGRNESYTCILLQDYSNTTDKRLNNAIMYYCDMPRLIIEAINSLLVIVVFFRMPFRYRKIKRDQEEFKVWLKQVLPILTHSVSYLVMNWFSLADHIYTVMKDSSHRQLQMAHAVTSASRGLVVGIVFTAYFLIMLYISWKHHGNKNISKEGLFSSSSINKYEKVN